MNTIQQQVIEDIESDQLVQWARRDLQEALDTHLALVDDETINSFHKQYLLKQSDEEIIQISHRLEKRLRVIQRAWIRLFPNELIELTAWTD